MESYPPIMTVGQHPTIVPPWAQVSPILAAGLPPIITVADPLTIVSGGPTQVHIPVAVAAGSPPIITVGTPGGRIGPPTCGMGGTAGVTIGQTCMSETRAAGGMGSSCSALAIEGRAVRFHRRPLLACGDGNKPDELERVFGPLVGNRRHHV